MIALISDHEVLINPYAVQMVLGAQEAASKLRWLLVLVNTGMDRAFEATEISALKDGAKVDGFLYMRMYHKRVVYRPNCAASSTVLIDKDMRHSGIPSVVPHELDGGLSAV